MADKIMKIKSRQFYKIPIKLVSPLSISAGTEDNTDHDVQRRADGTPFVAGSSVAGAFRKCASEKYGEDIVNRLFGHTRNEEGTMSRIFVSDIVFENAVISVRDGIALDENKTTKDTGKYDYEIVETGAEGDLRIEIVLYENDDISDEISDNIVRCFLLAVSNGYVRFGFKKNRGLGKVSLNEYRYRLFHYSSENAQEYLKFLRSVLYH